MTPKAPVTKEKIRKLSIIRIKTFCVSKDTIKKVKRQLREWEKIFASDISNKGLVCRIHKEPLQLNNKNTSQFKNTQKIFLH